MNFLAHAVVAARTGTGSPARVLGGVLPDLAGMAGCRVATERLDDEVRDGVACHHRADRAFHADRTFTDGARHLRHRALAAGLPPGASRAIGHAGWELLLDGALLGHSEAAGVFVAALACAPAVAGALPPAGRARWHGLVHHLAAAQWWRRYDEPDVVAEALRRRLQARPRLAFGPATVPAAALVLAGAAGAVDAAAEPTVDRVVARVADATPAGPRTAYRGEGKGRGAATEPVVTGMVNRHTSLRIDDEEGTRRTGSRPGRADPASSEGPGRR